MPLTWSAFRTQLRRSVLKDVPKSNWTDEALLDFCGWALDTVCAHTAAVTSVEYTGTTATGYTLPENLYESVEDAGLVYLRTSSGARTVYPVFYHPDVKSSDITYREWPTGTLQLSSAPGSGTLVVDYFAYYSHPVSDSDPIGVPAWMLPALGFLIAAYALSPQATQAANIRTFNDKTDSGVPTQNALEQLQGTFLRRYEEALARRPRQNRANFWQRNQPGGVR